MTAILSTFPTEGHTLDALRDTIRIALGGPPPAGLFIMTAQGNDYLPEDLDDLLQSLPVPLLGAAFPALIWSASVHHTGALVVRLPVTPRVELYPLGNAASRTTDRHADQAPHPSIGEASGTGAQILLTDVYSNHLNAFLETYFERHGADLHAIGAAAGIPTAGAKNAVYTNTGTHRHVVVTATLGLRLATATRHGFYPISPSLRVTAAQGDVIETIESSPAFPTYSRVVADQAGTRISPDQIAERAGHYPLGLCVLGREPLIRDPIATTEHGGLRVLAEIPTGSYVQVFTGDGDSLVCAAKDAISDIEDSCTDTPGTMMIFDCISRTQILGEQYSREMDMLADHPTAFGAITGGELAYAGVGFPEFLNKTITLGYFSQRLAAAKVANDD
ncbi:FIST signal transduction protein [Thioalkalivibrio sp. AKL12]|uniref:FIST signal transduction protein n=2 Tax=Thioalkalivibrio TaxID=106633 RepID=UPI00037458F5|nr:FIST C-terminal domain-containing protein [Thioalkalivibrio sp. AKL12]